MLLTIIMIIVFCFSALFSGIETGLVRLDTLKLAHAQQRGSNRAALLARLITRKDKLLAMTLIGNNLCVAIVAALSTSLMIQLFAFAERGTLLVTLIVTPLLLFFGEIVPKSLFLNRPTDKMIRLAPAIALIRLLFLPVITIVTILIAKMLWLLPTSPHNKPLERDDLKTLLDLTQVSEEEHRSEKKILARFLAFNQILAHDIMKPLPSIVSLPQDATLDRFVSLIRKTDYSRVQVYRERPDSIIGFVHVKDILVAASTANDLATIPLPLNLVNAISCVPETRKIADILQVMQQKGLHLVVVIDEYGASVGIITIEDILEEIFGEILDEYDDTEDEKPWRIIAEDIYEFPATLELHKLEGLTGLSLTKKRFSTTAGFLQSICGRIPHTGETICYENWRFTILSGTPQRIDTIRMERLSGMCTAQ